LDIVINNVGYILIGAAEEVSLAEAKEEFETNFFGTMRLVKTVSPIMRKQAGGRIINMSGPAGIVSVPFMGLFSASKAALEGYSLALRQEVKQFGIHVSLILPGPIQTQVVECSQRASQRLQVYEGQEHTFIRGWKNGYHHADQPAVVAAKVWNVLSSRAPRAHYTVGKGVGAFLLMRRLIPETLFETTMRRALGLDPDVARYIPPTGE
jgi:short-subunit dehydrogenase